MVRSGEAPDRQFWELAERAAQKIVVTTLCRKESNLPLKVRTLSDVCGEYLSWLHRAGIIEAATITVSRPVVIRGYRPCLGCQHNIADGYLRWG